MSGGLPVVDGSQLPASHRELLRPGELIRAPSGEAHRLPRFFYRVETTEQARQTLLTTHFGLWEFMEVDLYEPAVLREYPRYIPCAVTVLAAALQVLRNEVAMPVRVAANGGYRSPAHRASLAASTHCWATAANIYRIGSEVIDSEEKIQRFGALAARAIAGCWIRPFGADVGFADDHLHLDLGYATVVPSGHTESEA